MEELSRLKKFFCASHEEAHNKLIVEFVPVCLEGLHLVTIASIASNKQNIRICEGKGTVEPEYNKEERKANGQKRGRHVR